jgi:hypothetical protein
MYGSVLQQRVSLLQEQQLFKFVPSFVIYIIKFEKFASQSVILTTPSTLPFGISK